MARRTKGAERERAVVTAAADLISERGLSQLRMVDVADRAGMSVGHVTYYFPSKTELLIRAIRQSEEQFQLQVGAALNQQPDPWRRLSTLVELAAATGPRDPGWLLWFEVWANAAADEQVAKAQGQLDGWWREQMRDVIAYGIERGAFRTPDTARVVSVLTALTDGLSVQLALGSDATTRPELLDLVMGMARDLLEVRT